ncbi:MAG: zinc ribbon domain-containing protein [Planctomycetes bacterium]|nr:zinc ribbon domain-containing protein [Planctomycetota bacterium]
MEAVEGVRDVVEASAMEAEELRTLPRKSVDAIYDAGLFSMKVPEVLGGAEADPVTQIEVVEAEVIKDQQRRFRCENCGAEVATDPDQRSYVCAFCDSTYVIELPREETGKQRPEFVIGFALTPEQAKEKFRAWINQSAWFRPGDLSSAQVEDKQRGVYLPFWSFSMLAHSRWSVRIGEYWYRTETYTTTDSKGKTVTRTRRVRETEWWDLSGNHHRYYSGYLVSGSRGLPQSQAERIKPFQLPALQRYKPYFLAGWLSEEFSIERKDALDRCEQEFYRREQQSVAAFLPGDTHRHLHVNTGFSQINSDLILLPVFLLSYKYRDKLYRFLVNGQTGKIAGDKPLSWLRIWLAVGGGVLAVALVVVLFFLFGLSAR